MDRCKLFSKLTKSDDSNCTLFEELLDKFFEEYNALYGAMDNVRVVDEIAEIKYIEGKKEQAPTFKVMTKFVEGVTINTGLLNDLSIFLGNKLKNTRDVKIIKRGSDTILTTIVMKKG